MLFSVIENIFNVSYKYIWMYLTKVLKNILMYFILNLDIKKKLFLDMTFLYNQTHDSTQYYYEYKQGCL